MTKTKIQTISKQILYGFMAIALLFAYLPNIAAASTITPRKVIIGSSVASASTTYSFVFTVPSSTVVKSASFAACTTASGACTPAPGFSSSSSTLTGQPANLGDAAGWLVNTATSTELRLSKSGNLAAPTGVQTVNFSNVVNPNSTNQTFFVRITTFANSDWTSSIDTGTVASSTAGQVTVSTVIDEELTFTLATTSISLTSPTTGTTGTGTSSMTVSTNAATGYALSYSGSTLTSGVNTITAMSSAAASLVNNKQFGMNLVHNTTPLLGTAVSGTGSGAPEVGSGYDVANQYKFNTAGGDVIARATLPTNDNTYTASYIVNKDGSTPAGVYSTILTYTVTANF